MPSVIDVGSWVPELYDFEDRDTALKPAVVAQWSFTALQCTWPVYLPGPRSSTPGPVG